MLKRMGLFLFRCIGLGCFNWCSYDIEQYISYEGQINKYKDSYYEALKTSSEKWHENDNDYVPFIVNFLQVLYKCKDKKI